jgi:C4-dicarboxylate-specific signal transduction histidine kinase
MKESNKIQELLIRTLESSTLFRKVAPAMVTELASRMDIAHYNTGDTIINKDDEGITMFFIVSGEVKIHDREHLLANLGAGEFFGEMSILDREPRSMSVTATLPTTTGSIERNDLFDVINRFPGMTVELIGFLSRRLRRLNRFMVEQLKNRERELELQVAERTADLGRKNIELEKAINKLRESQQQLIMQEKLASLGSLTAGVAHELHNPLNFVNNFTELSLELLDEISNQIPVNQQEEWFITIKKNLNVIMNHGQRAESIIRAMIMHSNSGTGEKSLTNINELYEHSADMISFSAINTSAACPVSIFKELDINLPKIKVIQRDLSKALINLINNAYWEVSRKWRSTESKSDFKPQITIKSYLQNNKIILSISDNGDGVREEIKDKIFEPFFTTKPAGQGVGLGLSISNDIIRAHGGTITFTRTSEPIKKDPITTFIISLPV